MPGLIDCHVHITLDPAIFSATEQLEVSRERVWAGMQQRALAMVQAGIILAVGVFVFGARVHGNPVWLFVIVPLGSLVFLNIGFILSAWARTPAAASGMGNAVVLPMMFFAGTFFSTTTFPWIFPYLAEALPLTPMLSAMRQVAIDGAPLWETWPQLAIMAGWAAGTAVVAAKVFRFS